MALDYLDNTSVYNGAWLSRISRTRSEQRLYLLEAWRESPFYTDRERATLAWAESVTLVTEGHVPDEVFAQAREQFSEEELANLTLAVVAINGWNRLNIAFRTMPGSYQPATARAAETRRVFFPTDSSSGLRHL
jgi:hypothetical protein